MTFNGKPIGFAALALAVILAISDAFNLDILNRPVPESAYVVEGRGHVVIWQDDRGRRKMVVIPASAKWQSGWDEAGSNAPTHLAVIIEHVNGDQLVFVALPDSAGGVPVLGGGS